MKAIRCKRYFIFFRYKNVIANTAGALLVKVHEAHYTLEALIL